jgi:CheY-like chemotaxis protein
MERKHLLFVEDDKTQLEMINDALSDWSKSNAPRSFHLTTCQAVDEAKEALSFSRFDCALFDLRLPSTAGQKSSADGGNELAKIAFRKNGIPTAVISGNPADLEPELAEAKLLKAFFKGKGDPYKDAIIWFANLWDMMTVLASVRANIQSCGAEIFAGRVWPQWREFKKLKTDMGGLTSIVTRQYAGHIAEFMRVGEGSPDWHPFENYIRPALREKPYTGDIFDFDNQYWIVLTPPCDMSNEKVTNVILAHCDRAALPEWKDRVAELSKAQPKKDVAKYFRNQINQNIDASRHFLPPLDGVPIQVNFKELITKPFDDLKKGLTFRIASVAPAFLTNLTQRFGAYMSRTGQPNIDINHFADG